MKEEEKKLKAIERKEAMDTPVNRLPERELCAYEKIREDNIREREEAMAKSGFFETLTAYKKEIGLTEKEEEIPCSIVENY